MFGLTFVNPIFLAGAFALGAPLLIHLMTRRTAVRLVFPTIRFLQRAKASQSRIFRVRHWLMLALRTLALLLLLLAFLRPEYRARALVQNPAGEGAHAVVLVLDCSMSMAYASDGFSPFAKAKAAVESILNDLATGDVANVVFLTSHPETILDSPEAGIGALVQSVQTREVTLGRGDVDAALALAVRQLDGHEGSTREVYLVSDFQRANWAAANFGVIPEDVKTVFIAVSDPTAANGAITGVTVEPPFPTLGERVIAQASVANYSDTPRDVPVRLVFDGQEAPAQSLQIAARTTATATFTLPVDRPGLYEGSVTIPEDGLKPDDVRYFTVNAAARTGVVILTAALETDTKASPRFIKTALDPLEGQRTGFAPRLVSTDAYNAASSGDARVVILADAGPLSEATANELLAFVDDGGGLLVFLTGPDDTPNLHLLEAQSNERLVLPFMTQGFIDTDNSNTMPAVLQQANYDHPILRKFRESGALASLQFYRYYATLRRGAQGQLLMRYDNGHAALASTTYGAGSILLANLTPSPRGGDLIKQTVFVPLLHEMVTALRPQGGAARNTALGELASTTVTMPSPTAPLRITNPRGEPISAGIDTVGAAASVLVAGASQAGFYRVDTEGQLLGAMAVNVDARESDLAALTLDQLEDLSQLGHDRFVAQSGIDAASLRRLREGTPLWHYFVLALFAAMLCEQAIAWKWRR